MPRYIALCALVLTVHAFGAEPLSGALGKVATQPNTSAAAQFGFAAKKPIIAGACEQCVWGPLADYVKAAMAPHGYDIQVCYNCGYGDSPRYVSKAMVPGPLNAEEIEQRVPLPPKGPVDLGVTEGQLLIWNYNGTYFYQKDGPQPQLRLVAFIEDPVYYILAAKKSSGITDLSQLARARKPVKILTDGGPWLDPVFEYYGITRQAVESWGGRFNEDAMALHKDYDFDVLISSVGGTYNNLESNVWVEMSQKYDLVYFALPQELRLELARKFNLSLVELPAYFLRGVDRRIPTIGRSGHAIFGRSDMPDQFAYTLAKAIDESRANLRWYNRPFSYDSRTVWKDGNVPLHPGAVRYYREVGYLK